MALLLSSVSCVPCSCSSLFELAQTCCRCDAGCVSCALRALQNRRGVPLGAAHTDRKCSPRALLHSAGRSFAPALYSTNGFSGGGGILRVLSESSFQKTALTHFHYICLISQLVSQLSQLLFLLLFK